LAALGGGGCNNRPQPALARALAQYWRGAARGELAERWEGEWRRIGAGEK
jgi:hypothetical protein